MFCVLFWFLKIQKIDVSFASSSVPQSNVLLRREASVFFTLLMKQASIWLASSIRALVTERKRIKKYKRDLLEEDECPDMSPASLFCKKASQISDLLAEFTIKPKMVLLNINISTSRFVIKCGNNLMKEFCFASFLLNI